MGAVQTVRTAEVRWFRPGALPGPVALWFGALGEPVAPESRTDRYLAPTSDALGVKLREGRLEPKRRSGTGGLLQAGRAQATVGTWAKWSFPLADPDPLGSGPAEADRGEGLVAVSKTRRQRHVAAGGGSCALEIAEVEARGARWWSVCLEASGPDAAARRAALDAGAAWLARPDAPALPAEAAMGYPAWLRSLAS